MSNNKNESVVVPTQVPDVEVPVAKVEENQKIHVLNRYRIEKKNDDVVIYERIIVPETYANKKGVKKFTANNGKITFYAEKLVKKYSDNVVTS